ncbi:EAL domain-containing protein [Phenylobacterium sp.]|uniref:EAL domain-containing protein n=1 Tax=Phenylobacterium sp. TaxID=1871053 RepID=UPI0019B19B63|nr:EAL domain-containing protein [Phenylobacterium sp.]MBC7168202.1 EAL domain-containing protein [Phenylobacterium sp.]
MRALPAPWRARLRGGLPVLLLAALIVVLWAGGALRPVEDALAAQRFRLTERTATGQVVVVEIDAASLEAAGRWPWSRERYARAIANLQAAGAQSVGFDVDFSARSTPKADERLGQAISAWPGGVILPTFVQPRTHSRSGELVENRPIAELSDDALLASVNVPVDRDGRVRRYIRGFETQDGYRPSVAALLSEAPYGRTEAFRIDYAVRVDEVPRLSFEDVYQNRFDPEAVRGRTLLVGATALELGDNFSTPRYGVLPGVLVHALAFESLRQGRALIGLNLPAIFLLSAGLIAFVRPSGRSDQLTELGRRHVLVLGLTLGLPVVIQALTPVSIAIAPLLLAQALALAWAARSELRRRAAAIVQEREAGLLHLAMHEPETELPNRRALLSELTRMRQGDSSAVAVIVFGVDRYAAMRAAIGYGLSNEVVREIAARLLRTCRESRVAHLSTGVLGLVLRRPDLAALQAEVEALEALDPAYRVQGFAVDAFLRLGVAYAEGPSFDAEALVEQATTALDECRRLDRRRLVFDSAAFPDPDLNLSLMSDLRQGLERGELSLHYQPKARAEDGCIVGAEALLRWRHPDRGPIRPDVFISAAEETGAIRELTEWTIRRALGDVEQLQWAGRRLLVSVNISGRLLGDQAFRDFVLETIEGGPGDLCFEITETAVIENPAAAVEAIAAFRKAGVKISIDDYGVGLSSLSYLKLLEADELKLDRSLAASAHQGRRDRLIVRSTIELAHGLGMSVVGEGVETPEAQAALAELGCDLVQGYLIARPLPLADLLDFLDAQAKPDVTAAA